jgi:raffinose/stachyose/melibiose transport system permease protein
MLTVDSLRTKTAVSAFLLPGLLFYIAAVFMPIVGSLGLSLFDWDGITDPRFVGLDNYGRMLTRDPLFWGSVINSGVYLAINLLFQLGVGLFLANLLLSVTRGREVFKTLFFLPTIISTVAIAFLFRKFYAVEPAGLVNVALQTLGLGGLTHGWLSDSSTALVSVSIPEGWRFMGLYMVILYAALLAVPKEIEEAARMDGASEWQLFRRIRFPLIRPVWVTTMIMAATYSLRGFDIPYLLTNGGPGHATELLTTYMYKVGFTSTQFGYASTMAVFIVAECVLAVVLIVRVFRLGAAS